MAKSIRSKWKRKCRAIKRERYGKKELDRLKETLGIDSEQGERDVKMIEMAELATIKTASDIEDDKSKKIVKDSMDTDAPTRIFNPKTLRDQHGSYPVWVHPRKFMKKPKKEKKSKGKTRTNKS